MEVSVVNREVKTLEMLDTVATRKYPFTQKTLDQIKELRESSQDRLYLQTGEDIIVPAPVIIAEAVACLHKQELGE